MALRQELRLIHEKMEAKRITRIALAKIRALLAEEEEKEVAWALKMKMLEAAQEQLREERKKEAERMEREATEKAEDEILAQEKAEKRDGRWRDWLKQRQPEKRENGWSERERAPGQGTRESSKGKGREGTAREREAGE